MKEPIMLHSKPVKAMKWSGHNRDEIIAAFKGIPLASSVYGINELLTSDNVGVWVVNIPTYRGCEIMREKFMLLHFDIREEDRQACSPHTGFKVNNQKVYKIDVSNPVIAPYPDGKKNYVME